MLMWIACIKLYNHRVWEAVDDWIVELMSPYLLVRLLNSKCHGCITALALDLWNSKVSFPLIYHSTLWKFAVRFPTDISLNLWCEFSADISLSLWKFVFRFPADISLDLWKLDVSFLLIYHLSFPLMYPKDARWYIIANSGQSTMYLNVY